VRLDHLLSGEPEAVILIDNVSLQNNLQKFHPFVRVSRFFVLSAFTECVSGW
jgi:hypothetical protein